MNMNVEQADTPNSAPPGQHKPRQQSSAAIDIAIRYGFLALLVGCS